MSAAAALVTSRKLKAVGDVERLLGVEPQAAHDIGSANVQLLGLGQGAVGFLGRAQQVFLHHLVFASTASGSFHPVRHLPVGVDLLDDAADDACTGHGGKGAADEHASLLGRATCAIKRGVDLGQIAVDRIVVRATTWSALASSRRS